jgi:hypothetical protein
MSAPRFGVYTFAPRTRYNDRRGRPTFALPVPPVFERAQTPRGAPLRRLFLPLTTPHMACHSLRQPIAIVIRQATAWAAVIVLLAGGCKKADEIRDYTVANPPGPAETHRMLAAVVTDERSSEATETSPAKGEKTAQGDNNQAKESPGPRAWFFKLVGPVDQVEESATKFDQFVASIRTGKEGLPKWTLPEGWKEDSTAGAPQFGREATIRIGEGKSQLELAVSKLPMPEDRRESWLLGNINRWRGQLQLPPIARSELEEYTDEIKAGDETAIKVDFRGAFSGPPAAGMIAAKGAHGGTGAAPTQAPPRPSGTKASGAAAASAKRPIPFDAEVPGDWKPGVLNQFRVAAYNVGGSKGGAPAEVTVTPLGPAAGDLKANIDRWRGEIKLSPTTLGELAELTKSIEVDGQKADYVHLVGPEDAAPREATLGVILRRPDLVWFFKLRGPADVVEREKMQFEEYVKSVKFK